VRWFGAVGQRARACAIRELAEEVGMAATRGGVRASGAVAIQEPGFEAPSVDQLPQIGRWVAPEFMPVRFDARFFAVACERGVDPQIDGMEVDAAWWARPADLLVAHRAGAFPLAWPTLRTLEAMADAAGVEDVLALRIEQVLPSTPRPAGAPS
jgi:8-oxo-dGTP pyrophosphatase MutT (NUDIX family)